jgi:hypothetical protein
MSNKRTKQEKARIIEKCLDIEAEGGDVLKYLREEEHYVSPGATWFNIQRIELARDPYHRTSGKPTGVKIPRQQTPAAILAALNPAEVPPVQLNGMREKCRMVRQRAAELLKEQGRDAAVAYLKKAGIKQVDNMLYTVRKEFGIPAGKRGPAQKTAKTDNKTREIAKKSQERTKKSANAAAKQKLEVVKGPETSSYQFVPIRQIENDLEREFVRLVTMANLLPCGSDLEMIQEEIFLCLSQIRAVREVKNLGRKALKKEAG